MSGHGDEQAERILAAAVAEAPQDILGLVAALRTAMPGPFGRQEGLVHLLVHRMVRAGRLVVGASGATGLTRYHAPDAPAVAPTPVSGEDRSAAAAWVEEAARPIARVVRDPAGRARVEADLHAHLQSLDGADALERFGRAKALRNLMHRVDRGKPAVLVTADGGDTARRLLLHEGPWVLGAVIVFFVLKLWVVSPYKIPSASMLPTLREGDRVVVFQLFHRGVPDRYDVVVYERGGTNYVKRCVGLPGEDIALWQGDVYIDGELLVRPDWLVDALRSPVGSWQFGEDVPAGFADTRTGGMERWWWRSGRFAAHPNPGIHFGMHDGFAVLEGSRQAGEAIELILAHGPTGGRATSRGWVLRVDDAGTHLLRREGMDVTIGEPGEADVPLEGVGGDAAPTGDVRLALSYVDGVLCARCGAFRYQGVQASPGGDLTVGLARSLGAQGGLSLRLDRDHHYGTPREATHGTPVAGQRRGHRIAADRIFCLGDNTTNSRDSRFSQVGDIPLDAVVGPVSVRIWPPSRWGLVR